MTLVALVFWISLGLLVYTHLGYPLLLWAIARLRGGGEPPQVSPEPLPDVSLIVAAHDEEASILRWVGSTLPFEYPRERLEVVVVSDGSTDRTVEWAVKAGADVVFEVPRGGKVAALNAAVERARGEVLAFADANSIWQPDALRRLVARLADPRTGYVCGQLRLEGEDGENQEGLYWRYEMAVRALESRLAGVTAGNGAINAVRRDAYVVLAPDRGQDISLPFEVTKRGWRAVFEPRAVATEQMAGTLGAEFARKRRMLTGAWATILRSAKAPSMPSPSPSSLPCLGLRRSPRSFRCARFRSPDTTSPSPPPAPSRCGITCGGACPGPGRRRRGRGRSVAACG